MACLKGHVPLHIETNQELYSWLNVTATRGSSEWKPHLERKRALKRPRCIWWPHYFFLYCLCLVCHRLLVVLILDQEMYGVSSCMLWFWMDSVSENDGHVAVIFVDSGISFLIFPLSLFSTDEIMQQEIRPLLAVDIIEQLHRQFAMLSGKNYSHLFTLWGITLLSCIKEDSNKSFS